jgi:hypothetical protein
LMEALLLPIIHHYLNLHPKISPLRIGLDWPWLRFDTARAQFRFLAA